MSGVITIIVAREPSQGRRRLLWEAQPPGPLHPHAIRR